MTTTPTALKVCGVCGDELPIECFRLRRATGSAREARCRRCYAAYMRHYRRQKRSAALRAFSAAVAKGTSFYQVQELCDQMFRRFGGVAKFAEAWASEIKAAAATGQGKSRAIKAMLAVANLHAMVQLNPPPSPFGELTDEQLRDAIQHKLRDLLRDGPT